MMLLMMIIKVSCEAIECTVIELDICLVNSDPVWLGARLVSSQRQFDSASALLSLQNPHTKGSKEHLFIMTQTYNLQILRVIPFAKLQNDTSTTVKR